MEDAHVAQLDIVEGVHLFGVFDGHGGAKVARYVSEYLPKELLANKDFQEGKYENALTETFLKLDRNLREKEGLKVLYMYDQEALAKMGFD